VLHPTLVGPHGLRGNNGSNECGDDMVEQLANPPPTAMFKCLGNLLPPTEDIQIPVIFISEEEQFVRHELIKALRQLLPPFHPFSCHESFSNNEAIVVHLEGNKNYYRQRKVKMKFRKPSFKVI
jgi:hypothetical protein